MMNIENRGDVGREREITSIDLLEECYLTIYQIRKLSKQVQRNHRNSSTKSTEVRKKIHFQDRKTSAEFDTSSKLPSPALSRAPSTISRAGSINEPSDRQQSLPHSSSKISKGLNSPQKRQNSQSINSAHGSSNQQSPGVFSMGFNSLEDQRNDKEATDIYEAFKKELRHWWNTNTTKRNDEDLRGDLADDLTERYLCQRLDPLPPSRVVTNIRKTISHVVEDFASRGVLPSDIITPPEEEKISEPLTKFAKEKQLKELKEIAEQNERKERYQRELQESSAARVEQEKKRIKEQYESYMKLKNQSKTIEREDDKREKELENHLDDIRSLISSIKGTGHG